MNRRSRRPIEATIRASGREDSDPATRLGDGFREVLSYWASGVAIVAATDGDEIDAITVSSFISLSADPPLVLVSVGEQTSVLPMLLEERRFTVSILAEDQKAIAGAVAQRLPGSESVYQSLENPTIQGALGALTCRLWDEYAGGDHRIIIGEVERVWLGDDADPLVYFRREYRGLG